VAPPAELFRYSPLGWSSSRDEKAAQTVQERSTISSASSLTVS
jgi:hypothetical protein